MLAGQNGSYARANRSDGLLVNSCVRVYHIWPAVYWPRILRSLHMRKTEYCNICVQSVSCETRHIHMCISDKVQLACVDFCCQHIPFTKMQLSLLGYSPSWSFMHASNMHLSMCTRHDTYIACTHGQSYTSFWCATVTIWKWPARILTQYQEYDMMLRHHQKESHKHYERQVRYT